MTCDQVYSLSQLFGLSLRPDDSGNLIVDTVETEVADACVSFDDCSDVYLPFMALLSGLFEERDVNCWAVRVNIQSAVDCDQYITCDNGVTWVMAMRRAITKGSDGKPVLNIADIGQLSPTTCDDFQSFLSSMFWTDGDCVAVRGGAGGSFDECAKFDCDSIPGGWRTAIQRAIGLTDDGCPAFLFLSGSITPTDCDLDLLDAALTACQSGDMYMWVLSNDGDNAFTGFEFHFYYDNGSGWTEFSPGMTDGRSDPLPFVDAQYKVVMICNGDSKEVVFPTLGTSYFQYYINYQINAGAITPGDSNLFYYVAEGDTITLHSLDPNASGYWYMTNPSTLLASNTQSVTVDFSDAENDSFNQYQLLFDISIVDNLNSGCSTGSAFKVQYVPKPVVTDSQSGWICSGGNLLLTARFGNDDPFDYTTYQWYRDNVLLVGETNDTLTTTTAGTYKVVGTYNGVTVTSLDHVVTIQTDVPQPVMTFDIDTPSLSLREDGGVDLREDGGNELEESAPRYYFDGTTYYFESCDAGFNMVVSDVGVYSGGYPAGTLFTFFGAGAIVLQGQSTSNVFFNAYQTDGIYCEVQLPASLGGCVVATPVYNIDFQTVQCPQISGFVTTVCNTPPDAGDWAQGDDTPPCSGSGVGCLCDGNSAYYVQSYQMGYTLDNSTPGQVTINCDFQKPNGAVPIDMSQNIVWWDVLNNVLLQTGGLSLVVTAPGVYGAYCESVVYPTIKTDFFYFNFIVQVIP